MTQYKNFRAGRIIRTGFNDFSLFTLAFRLYFQTALVLAVDFDRFRMVDPLWIDLAVANRFKHNVPVIAARLLNNVAPHALLRYASLLRRFLCYTDIR
jgi:hypothetical protein